MATYMWTALERRTGKIRLHRLACRFIRIGQEPVFSARTKYFADPIPARYPLEDPAVATDSVSPTSSESRNPSALYPMGCKTTCVRDNPDIALGIATPSEHRTPPESTELHRPAVPPVVSDCL